MDTDRRPRDAAREALGFLLYALAWGMHAILPALTLAGVAVDVADGDAFRGAVSWRDTGVALAVPIAVGFALRWMAAGVIARKRLRTVAAALCALLLGAAFLLMLADPAFLADEGPAMRLQSMILGAALLALAALAAWTIPWRRVERERAVPRP